MYIHIHTSLYIHNTCIYINIHAYTYIAYTHATGAVLNQQSLGEGLHQSMNPSMYGAIRSQEIVIIYCQHHGLLNQEHPKSASRALNVRGLIQV